MQQEWVDYPACFKSSKIYHYYDIYIYPRMDFVGCWLFMVIVDTVDILLPGRVWIF